MRVRPFVIALSIALSAACLATPGLGQSIFGTILGTLTDASGAVVPSVTVTVTNQGENISHEVQTDAQGNYQAENLKAGVYTIKVNVTGFREITVKDIVVTARQTVRADLKLTMGATSEQVTVEALPELINTESQSVSSSFNSTEVLELPANYRGAGSTSPYTLLAFLPGVTGDGFGNITVQGAGVNQVEYSLDGISTTSIRSSGPQREMFPSAESIAEMKVQGSGGGAEYGSPADITTTSKSGTNAFHGSAFEYFQNAALDATRFVADSTPGKAAKSANTFGGSSGGPLWGKHTFFFGDYEGMRYRTQTLDQETVPSQAMRNGDFSGLLGGQLTNCGSTGDQPCFDALNRPIFQNEIYDPATTRIVNAPLCGTPGHPPCKAQVQDGFGFDPVTGFPIAGKANIVPSNRFDSRVAAILPFYPLPNVGGVNNFAKNNLTRNVPNPILSDQFDIRIDHTINDKQNVFGRWTYKNKRFVTPSTVGLPAEADSEHDNQVVLAHNYVITPNLVNELRGGISRVQFGGNFPLDGPAFMQKLGLNPQQLGPFPKGGFPDFIFEPRNGNVNAIVHTRPDPQLNLNFQINENLSWTKGKHTMKFGFDLRRLHLITAWYSGSSQADDYGDFFFNGQYSGNNFSDFLLGVPYFTYVTHTPPRNIDGKATHLYGYAADTFRATQKLTLNFGLRVSRIPPLYDPINLTNFDPSVPGTGRVIISSDPRSLAATQPLWAQAVNACTDRNKIPNYSGPDGINPCTPFLTSQQAGWPKALRNVYTNFTPRLGFAYRPFADNKTVIRGGAGIYDVTTLGAVFFSVAGIHDGFQGNFSNKSICLSNSPSGTCSRNPNFFQFPDVLNPNPLNTGYGTQSFFTANRRDKKDPYSIEWNLSVERVLHGNTSLRVSYIASRANQLTWSPNLNQPLPTTDPNNLKPNPFPAWQKVRIRTSGAISTYESMQTEIIHKYSHGLTFQSTWTWARNLSDVESWPGSGFGGEITGDKMDLYHMHADYGNTGGTRKHRWITTMVDELPIGKGRFLLGNAHGVLNGIVGGWRLSTIFLAETGPYETPFLQFDSSGNSNFGFNRPDLAGNPNNFNHTSTQWWNPNVFACPGRAAGQDLQGAALVCPTQDSNGNPLPLAGRFGNAGVGTLIGPKTFNLSLGMAKSFRVTERVTFKFESSFTNVLNHINFDDPDNNLTNGTFGKVFSARSGDAGGNRVGQLAVRIEF
jgi:Carboxypeptidase regulatory-like domain